MDPLVGLARVYNKLGDLSSYDVDGPVPEPVIEPEVRSNVARLLERVKREKMTIRQLYSSLSVGGFCLVGTASDIVDVIQEWFEAGACDGFNILPTHLPVGCEDFVEFITPELQRRGLFRYGV